jgi:RNA polymerase sigma-70 factor (ECF subfamily)
VTNWGRRQDWDRIVREHGPMVYTTAWRILGQAADAEDVVQDVFMEVFRRVARPESSKGVVSPNALTPFASCSGRATLEVRCWPALLHRLTTFRALDRLRRRKATVGLDGLCLFSPNGDPESLAIGRELADRLRQAIAQLPQREGTVFCMRYFDELSYDQIAENLAISRGAVAAALHKARAKLESLLGEPVHGDVL